ncbi:MarR family transcriptional regulator [Candidatus Micrarchaeota archaeon]|nr:MarR family transcriptional regulator [Candidatus Micrarchaeota archaeon]
MFDEPSIWELYGLKANPFSTSPLLVRGGLLPIELFQGRKGELTRLSRLFSSSNSTRALVCGDVGVGKTSFVNYARHQAMQKGYFTPFKEIGVNSDWTATDFMLNTLYAFYSTLKLQKKTIVSKQVFDKLERLVELPYNQTKLSGASALGVGVRFANESVSPPTIPSMALMDFAQQLFNELFEKTGKPVIIHYNNLENVPEQSLRKLYDDLRDFFQSEHVHFVFVGNFAVHSLFQSMPRVASTLSDTPLIISELPLDQIELILESRIKALRISEGLNYVVPYSREALVALYGLYGGNVRNILNSFSAAVIESTNEKPVVLGKTLLASVLNSLVEKRHLVGITQARAKDVLLEAVRRPEVTNRELSKHTKIARSNVSYYLRELEKKGCIYLRRRDGKDKYYCVEPSLRWLLLEKRVQLEKQAQ